MLRLTLRIKTILNFHSLTSPHQNLIFFFFSGDWGVDHFNTTRTKHILFICKLGDFNVWQCVFWKLWVYSSLSNKEMIQQYQLWHWCQLKIIYFFKLFFVCLRIRGSHSSFPIRYNQELGAYLYCGQNSMSHALHDALLLIVS